MVFDVCHAPATLYKTLYLWLVVAVFLAVQMRLGLPPEAKAVQKVLDQLLR